MRDLRCYPNSNGIKDLLLRTNYISRKPVYDFFKEKLEDVGGCVLDLGCGSQPYRPLLRNCSKYIGLDVDTAKDYGFSDKDVTYYDGKNIPVEDQSVDCVMSVQVFEHIEDLDYSLGEIHRVLKQNGVLCFSVPMAYPIHMDPYDFRRFTHYGISKKLEAYGFTDIRIEGSNREVDSLRFLKIRNCPRIFRYPHTALTNLCFIYGYKRPKRLTVRLENLLRKILHRNPKVEDLKRYPLDYLCYCIKK